MSIPAPATDARNRSVPAESTTETQATIPMGRPAVLIA
jgi:hypothetical protein